MGSGLWGKENWEEREAEPERRVAGLAVWVAVVFDGELSRSILRHWDGAF
jgi:hypothetical protein